MPRISILLPRMFVALLLVGALMAVTHTMKPQAALAFTPTGSPCNTVTDTGCGGTLSTTGTVSQACSVTVTQTGADAGFDDFLFIASPATTPAFNFVPAVQPAAPTGFLLWNHGGPVTQTFTVPGGTLLDFRLFVQDTQLNTQNTWGMGTGGLNSDSVPHAIVTDLGGGIFQVAFEDKTFADPQADWDYNDEIYQFQSTCLQTGGNQGCTLGFWKNHQAAWVGSGFTTGQKVNSVFTVPVTISPLIANATLLQALNFGGGPGLNGGAQILLKQAVAALLNSAELSYPLTTAQVIAQVNTALAGSRADMITLSATLDADNSLHNNSLCS